MKHISLNLSFLHRFQKYFFILRYLIFIKTVTSTHFIVFSSIKGQLRGNYPYISVIERVNKISMTFYKFISALFVIVLGMPFHMALLRWMLGTYSPDVWFLPYRTLFVSPFFFH